MIPSKYILCCEEKRENWPKVDVDGVDPCNISVV